MAGGRIRLRRRRPAAAPRRRLAARDGPGRPPAGQRAHAARAAPGTATARPVRVRPSAAPGLFGCRSAPGAPARYGRPGHDRAARAGPCSRAAPWRAPQPPTSRGLPRVRRTGRARPCARARAVRAVARRTRRPRPGPRGEPAAPPRPPARDDKDGLPVDRLSTDLGGAALTDYGTRLRRRWWVVALGALLGLAVGLRAARTRSRRSTPRPRRCWSRRSSTTSGEQHDDDPHRLDVNLDTEVAAGRVRAHRRTPSARSCAPASRSARCRTRSPSRCRRTARSSRSPTPAARPRRRSRARTRSRRPTSPTAPRPPSARSTSPSRACRPSSTPPRRSCATSPTRSAALVAGSADSVYADAQRKVVATQVNDLTQRLAPLHDQPAATPGSIITDAPLPKNASAPIPALDLGGGLVVGLLLGLAAWRSCLDRRDHRLRRGADVTCAWSACPSLADVPAETARRSASPATARARSSTACATPSSAPAAPPPPCRSPTSTATARHRHRSPCSWPARWSAAPARPCSSWPTPTRPSRA